MPLFVAGLSHKNAGVELREQLAVEEDKLREVLADLQAATVLREVVVVSTCNRVEVYGVAEAPGEARALVFRHLCRQRGVDLAQVEGALYTHLDGELLAESDRRVLVAEAGDEERHQDPWRPGRKSPAPSVSTSAANPKIAK